MSKINVLVLPSDRTGVGKFRSVDPHVYLQNHYSEEFHVDIDYEPRINDENYWKKYQIVHFHRVIGRDYINSPKIIEQLGKWGIVTICDIDDYWSPGKEHPAYDLVKKNNLNMVKMILECDIDNIGSVFVAQSVTVNCKSRVISPIF